MIGLLQRVSEASVSVDGDVVGRIDRGLMVLCCVQPDDQPQNVRRMAERLAGYRVFEDDTGRMNLSVSDIDGALLLVPQFTLAADTRKGMRASFSRAAPPELGSRFFDLLVEESRNRLDRVETGRFGADMKVALVNDGPVTFWLEA